MSDQEADLEALTISFAGLEITVRRRASRTARSSEEDFVLVEAPPSGPAVAPDEALLEAYSASALAALHLPQLSLVTGLPVLVVSGRPRLGRAPLTVRVPRTLLRARAKQKLTFAGNGRHSECEAGLDPRGRGGAGRWNRGRSAPAPGLPGSGWTWGGRKRRLRCGLPAAVPYQWLYDRCAQRDPYPGVHRGSADGGRRALGPCAARAGASGDGEGSSPGPFAYPAARPALECFACGSSSSFARHHGPRCSGRDFAGGDCPGILRQRTGGGGGSRGRGARCWRAGLARATTPEEPCTLEAESGASDRGRWTAPAKDGCTLWRRRVFERRGDFEAARFGRWGPRSDRQRGADGPGGRCGPCRPSCWLR